MILKQPDIIDTVEIYENDHPTKMEEISHFSNYSGLYAREDGNYNLQIKGKPANFKEVTIPDNAKLEETDKIAFGHDVSDVLPVFRYTDDAGQECLVARKDQDMTMTRQLARKIPGLGYMLLPPTYYQTKKVSDCPNYRMMEPVDDFLRSHYQEKLKGPEGITYMKEKAEENTRQLWRQFSVKRGTSE
ncbi:hypothetical protein [Endozoicomonas sp. Mp262]|uniref:hypothetical protein n=1 Tax=Endozoicomonas sp. Mp262 TaxID=2919499 RepID=UPI0021DA0A0F